MTHVSNERSLSDMATNLSGAIPVLRAARLLFERAGNKALVAATEDLIAEVIDEARIAERQAKREEAIRRAEGIH